MWHFFNCTKRLKYFALRYQKNFFRYLKFKIMLKNWKFLKRNCNSEFCVANWSFKCLSLFIKMFLYHPNILFLRKFFRPWLKLLNFIEYFMTYFTLKFVNKLFIHQSNIPSFIHMKYWRAIYWWDILSYFNICFVRKYY